MYDLVMNYESQLQQFKDQQKEELNKLICMI